MILDENLEFCDDTSVAASAGTALVGDVVDLGANAVNPGRGEQLYLIIQVTEAFTSGGSATVQFTVASDAQAAIATDGTATEHAKTQVLDFDATDLALGEKLVMTLPQGRDYERYLGVLVTTATATTTAGSINAFLTWEGIDNNHSYPDGVN